MIEPQKNMIEEIQPPYFLLMNGGCEATSNKRDMKIKLHHSTILAGAMENQTYYTVTYIREDDGWIRTENQHTFSSIEEFMDKLRGSEDFTSAYRDYQLTKK